MRVLVTGATGFLGGYVVRALLKRNVEPIPTTRKESDRGRLAGSELGWVELDMTSTASIQQVLAQVRPDAVVNCAAYGVDFRQQVLEEAIAVNVAGTAALVEAAAQVGVERFIHVGTCFEYGEKQAPIRESDLLEPVTLYGTTKAAGTLLALERAHALALRLAVVRPFGMYGPLEGDHKLVPLIRMACKKGEPLPLTKGEQIRDYLYVGDVAEAIVEMLSAPLFPDGEVFNLGSGTALPLKDFIMSCARAFGGESFMRLGELEYRANEMWTLVADCSKWERFYGRPLARTRLEEGLARFSDHEGDSEAS